MLTKISKITEWCFAHVHSAKICRICSHVHMFPKSTKKLHLQAGISCRISQPFPALFFSISGFFYVSLVIVMMIGPASKPWKSELGRETVMLTSSVVLFFPVFINLYCAGTDQRRAPVNNDMQVSNCERMVMDNDTSRQDNSFYLQVSNQCWTLKTRQSLHVWPSSVFIVVSLAPHAEHCLRLATLLCL